MRQIKTEVLSIRTTGKVKDLIRKAAQREHRSMASMVEVMVFDYAASIGVTPAGVTSAKKKIDR